MGIGIILVDTTAEPYAGARKLLVCRHGPSGGTYRIPIPWGANGPAGYVRASDKSLDRKLLGYIKSI